MAGNLRFGDYVLYVEARRLLHQGVDVHLSPKAFELLKTLVENHPRAVSKAELHDRLWPGIFVSEGNLALLMTEIRNALGDDARAPRFVRTLHGFGYAFQADVTTAPPMPRVAAPEEPSHWLLWENHSFRLALGENVVGRHPGSEVLLDLPGVSRRHACITVGEPQAVIRDLGSKNGTIVRGDRIGGPVPIDDRDQIQIGPATLTYRVVVPVQGTETFTFSAGRSASSPRR